MNKEFVRNIIKSEKYKYQAIKDILPSDIKKKVDDLEREALDIIKVAVLEIMKEDIDERTSKNAIQKTTKKVDVDFSL